MSSVLNKTQLAEKRYRDKLKKVKKEIRLNNKKHEKRNKTNGKSEEDFGNCNHQVQKTKKQQNYKRKNYMK